ncbi:hypothetical protein ADL29_12075 [Streptomyces chattanoogensis]|uniref:Uncharacterized protein n=1 Tax=Streptomyces chattanoogensis TaxID=66876 RepID=A0A0N0XWR1_9ACTN|nr:hypothetical protein ADL29_12075 [Streptomyces chattanoogensis]
MVTRIDQGGASADPAAAITGATCLCALYDPASRTCAVARAGHILPAPNRRSSFLMAQPLIVITGAGSGIGAATARAFAGRGSASSGAAH